MINPAESKMRKFSKQAYTIMYKIIAVFFFSFVITRFENFYRHPKSKRPPFNWWSRPIKSTPMSRGPPIHHLTDGRPRSAKSHVSPSAFIEFHSKNKRQTPPNALFILSSSPATRKIIINIFSTTITTSYVMVTNRHQIKCRWLLTESLTFQSQTFAAVSRLTCPLTIYPVGPT